MNWAQRGLPRWGFVRLGALLIFAIVQIAIISACRSAATVPVAAPGFRVALLTPGPVSDGGWNAAAFDGLQLIKQRLGAETAMVQTRSPADFDDAFRDFASRGFDLIFAHGFEYSDEALKVASSFPNSYFIVSSGAASSSNVASLTFNVDEATYVEGVLAGGVSKSGVAGAIGGIELPSIRMTFEGFKRGFLSVQPKGRVLISYTGNFDDIGAAKEAALAQVSQGADVLIHNADAAGLGVFEAAQQTHVFAFGAFNNQNNVAPDVVLASAVTSTPLAFLKIAQEVKAKQFHPGMLEFGMKDGMVNLVLNPKLESHIPGFALERARRVEQEFISGQALAGGS
ncbi:MAG TPA: BMP family protein [Candidatus Binataceae bacterium]|nr:BMP family protein [Candidatus Binataceae bacterium]